MQLHVLQIEYAEKKKAEGKKMRDDKDAVLDMLFAAFEKHQYYNIRDLVKITRQPIVNIFLSLCDTLENMQFIVEITIFS